MKKDIIIGCLILVSCFAQAQNCPNPIVSCPDTVTSSKDTLAAYLPPGYSNPRWSIAYGPGVIANPTALYTSVSGLQVGVTVIVLNYETPNSGGGYAITTKTWLPAACPPPPVCPPIPAPRTVVSVSCGSGKCTATYSDGSTSTF